MVNMKRIVHFLVLVCLLIGIAIIDSCKKEDVIPTLTTIAVTNITVNSGTTGGLISKDGGAAVTARGVCWGITSSPAISGSHTSDDNGTGSFTSNLTGLTPNTLYHVRAYATNKVGTAYGNEVTFTTSPIVIPTVTTTVVSSITLTTAVSGGNITSDGNGAITARGVCWATTSTPTITNSLTTDSIGTGSFTSNLSTLLPGTTYYVRAYATNSAGTAYGNELSFTTNTVVGAPTNVSATSGNAQATVAFTAPASDGGSAITGYTVTSSPGGFTGTGSASPIIVIGLTNGTAYTFTVIATNSNGNSSPSTASNSVIPSTVPGAPTIGTATGGNTQSVVAFVAPISNGGSSIIAYTVTSIPGGLTGTGSTSPITVTGLTNGNAYTFTVIATNAKGNSPASSASNSVTPSSVPGAPTIGTATKGNAQATVTFTAPASNGGSVITGYTVTSNPGTITRTGSSSPITVTGLTNGTAYTFTVVATNASGKSLPSSASNSVTPSTVPGAPTIGTATEGDAQTSVTFTAPVSNGGSTITGYTVTSIPGSFTGTGAASPITVTGLTNGTAYTFTVMAANANGNGLPSSASNSVRPHTLSTIYDIEGNLYNLVSIGGQVWMKENLKTSKYNTGASIPTTTAVDLTGETAPKYQWIYNDDNANLATYGRLYTLYAITDPAGVCPTGWHVPSDAEWMTLYNFLIDNGFAFTSGGVDIGKSMASTSGWTTDPTAGNVGNNQATNNTSGFSAVPAGFRKSNLDPVVWHDLGSGVYFRSSTEDTPPLSWYYYLRSNSSILGIASFASFNGYSVRCVR